MPSVATKELKNRLSHYLRMVRAGARFVVTDRGRPVAEIGPLKDHETAGSMERVLMEAAARGEITLPRGRGFLPARPIRMRGRKKLSDAVLEDRQ